MLDLVYQILKKVVSHRDTSEINLVSNVLGPVHRQPRSQGLSFCHLGETLAAAGHVPPRFWEANLIVTVRGVGKERVCSVLKLQLWVMKFTVNLQQEIVKRTLKLIFIS
jgi:hypothetical protein